MYMSKILSTVLMMLDFWSHSASKKIENEEKEEDKKTKRKAKTSKLFIGVKALRAKYGMDITHLFSPSCEKNGWGANPQLHLLGRVMMKMMETRVIDRIEMMW